MFGLIRYSMKIEIRKYSFDESLIIMTYQIFNSKKRKLSCLAILPPVSWPGGVGWVIVPKVFIFTSTVIFPISYVPKVNLNQKY